jgi:Putative zinc-finger
MRCRDAKDWLTAQRENDLVQSEVTALQEHLKECSACHTYEQYHRRTDPVLNSPTSHMFTSISTERIMQAVERQKRITEQLEGLRTQQRTRIARLRIFTPRYATLTYLSMGLISLLLLALLIFNTDIVVNILESFGGIIDTLVVLAQFLQSGLAFVLQQEWLLSAMALVLVIMTGMWLRLMRHPQEA